MELLKAISILDRDKTVTLDCFGNKTDPLFFGELESLAISLPAIKLNGPISGIDKFQKLAQSDVIILPSYNEGMPLVLMEAMSIGLPIITTGVGFIPELLGPDYPFYCEPKNVDSLKQTLQKFFDYEKRTELSEYLLNRFQMNFSYAVHERRINEIFFN